MIFGFRTYPKIIVICRSIFDPFLVQLWSISGGILGFRTVQIDQKTDDFVKLLLGEVWGVILDDFGTYLGAILEALEVILGAWGPFWRRRIYVGGFREVF